IEDNAFAGNLTAQIKVAGVSAPATVGIVRNSFSLDGVDDGSAIVLLHNDDSFIQANGIDRSPHTAIVIGGGDRNVTITTNVISNGGADAIALSDNGSGFGANGAVDIENNAIIHNGGGITVGAGMPVPPAVRLNLISGNTTAIATTDASAV